MQPQELLDFAQRNTPPYGDMLTPLLAGKEAGAKIIILANGPSAALYKPHKGDIVIACNNALALAPKAAYWLVCEGAAHVFPWFWEHTGYKGQVIWDRFIGNCTERLIAEYGAEFLSRVCWSLRCLLTDSFRLRYYRFPNGKQGGLVQSEIGNCPVGTVLMQAIHLAGILGASAVEIYGGELYFPQGKQHADGSQPFTENDGETGIIYFEIVDGEPQPVPMQGSYQTTRQFYYSAAAIRDLIGVIGDEMEITDHSAGLLCPSEIPLKAERAEPGKR